MPFPDAELWHLEEVVAVRHDGGACGDEVLGDKGGPNQANLEELAFILWCLDLISGRFEEPVNFGSINELGLTMSSFFTVFF